MEERLFRNRVQQAYTDQQRACLQASMLHHNDRTSVVHSTQPFLSMAWSNNYFPVYQSGLSIPFGLSVCAESVNPRVTRRVPSTSEQLIRWTENYRCRASLQAAMKPRLPVAQRTQISLPAALKTSLPAALNVQRRFRPRYIQTPAFAQDGSVAHEKVSFVEYAGSFHPQLAHHAVRSMAADVPVLDKSTYSGTATEWRHIGDNEYQQSEPQSFFNIRTIHSQFGGATRNVANVSKVTETAITIDVKNCYSLQEANNSCAKDDDPATGNGGDVVCNGDDDGRVDSDDGCQTCSEDEDDTADDDNDNASCNTSVGGGSDEKTREAVANLLAGMAKESRKRKRYRNGNGRASRRRSTGTQRSNETETVNKLLSFTRMRCPYQEYPRARQTVPQPNMSCTSNNKSIFWASDDYILETSLAVKALLDKY